MWKQWPLAKLEGAFLRAVDVRTGQIRRQQIRRELQTVEVALDAFGQHLDRTRLREPRGALYQQVAVAQQRDQHAVDQVRLTDNQPARMCFEFLKLFPDAH